MLAESSAAAQTGKGETLDEPRYAQWSEEFDDSDADDSDEEGSNDTSGSPVGVFSLFFVHHAEERHRYNYNDVSSEA